MVNNIISKNNKIITQVKSLHIKKYRDKYSQFFVEGYLIVEEALKSNADIEFAIINSNDINDDIIRLIDILKKKNINTYYVDKKLFEQISDTKTPQGILAVINTINHNNNEIIEKSEFLVLLENIQDPGNMGTIIRTADASGISGIILSSGCVDIFNPKVLRSTMGSIFHIPVIQTNDFENLIKRLSKNNFSVYAAHPYGEKICYEVNMKNKTAIVIGNEANGLSEKILSKCIAVKIPMLGKAESLNASVAASLLMYEKVRQNL